MLFQLTSGIKQLGLSVSSDQLDNLCVYLTQMIKWNKVYNLTAIRDAEQMVVKHLLDSLVVNQHLPSVKHVLDVGTGPGLPGIPLAILNPDIHFSLCDSNGKKTRFLNYVVPMLSLDNVTVHHARVESLTLTSVDLIISRAYSSVANFIETTQHLLQQDGIWFAMKGAVDRTELADLTEDIKINKTIELDVPGLEAERHLIVLSQT